MSYRAPTIAKSSVGNGPATGGERVLITGDDFGVYDYSATVSIGETGGPADSFISYIHSLAMTTTGRRSPSASRVGLLIHSLTTFIR